MQQRAAAGGGEQADPEYDVPAHEELMSSDDGRDPLRAAAEALRTWVHAQREAARSGKRFDATSAALDRARQAATAPVVQAVHTAEPPSPPQDRPFQSTSILGIDTVPMESSAPTWIHRVAVGRKVAGAGWRVAVAAAGIIRRLVVAHRELILKWGRRAAMASAILALIVGTIVGVVSGARWVERTYGPKVSTTLATFTASTTGTAALESVPSGSQVFVDGTVVGTTPMITKLSQGRHLVEFRRDESIRSLEIDVRAGQSTVARLDWTAKRTATLRVQSTPTGAKVVVDGREQGVTPFETSNLTVGTHDVLIESAAGSVRRTVNLRLDRATELSEVLYSGWVHVSSPIEVAIAQGTRRLQLDDQNRVLLPPGEHDLQFDNGALGYREVRRVRVRPGETTRLVIAPTSSSLSVTATEAAEVLVDGERAGATPLTNHPVALGTHDIVVRAATGAERKFTTTVTATPAQLDVDFSTTP